MELEKPPFRNASPSLFFSLRTSLRQGRPIPPSYSLPPSCLVSVCACAEAAGRAGGGRNSGSERSIESRTLFARSIRRAEHRTASRRDASSAVERHLPNALIVNCRDRRELRFSLGRWRFSSHSVPSRSDLVFPSPEEESASGHVIAVVPRRGRFFPYPVRLVLVRVFEQRQNAPRGVMNTSLSFPSK